MRRTTRVAAFTAVLTGLVTALTVTAPAHAAPNCQVTNPPPICDRNPDGPTDPPEGRTPELAIDGARQTTNRAAVHIWGWAADPDSPRSALAMSFTVDGASAGSMTANHSRPDVAVAHSNYGAAHGFDITVPASAAGHTICVTATSVGGGPNRKLCVAMDDIVQFEANDIAYDTSRAVLTDAVLEQLDKVTNVNNTALQQSTEISGSKVTTDVKGWRSTESANLTVSTSIKAGFPIFAEGKVNVSATGSTTVEHNGQTTLAQTFSWRQPVLVPARSRVEATVLITHFTVSVPYTMFGNFAYRSGIRVPGTFGGVFTGSNSTNLVVNLQQFNVDGTPSAAPASQPAATLLKATPAG